MKLALVSGEFPPQQGGVGDYTREMARELSRRDVEVCVVTSESEREAKIAVANEEQYALNFTNFRRWRSLGTVDELTRDCDIIHIQYQAAAYGMMPPIHLLPRYLRPRQAKRKVVVTYHDLRVPYLFPKAGSLRQRAVFYLGNSADGIVVTNQEDRLALSRNLKHTSRVELIPIGSNIEAGVLRSDHRAEMRKSLGVADGETLLCYFGFLNASKGGETLMRVLAVLMRTGYAVQLLMLGGETGASDPTNAAYAQKVKALSVELGVSERVIWAGYRPSAEVTALWQASDIALLPYEDGVSLRRGTLMAALAHSMPIVSTKPRVPIEQLCDGENIALAVAGDVEGLARTVSTLIEAPERRQQMAQAAGKLATAFAWPRIVDQHLALYRELLGA
jgi:glycosyltransferase involved in cell wall biosynthesis